MRYNYREAVTADTLDYIRSNYTPEEIREKLEERNTWADELHDELWTADSVTGNGSGSYTFNSWKAEENLMHNLDLLADATVAFGCDMNILKDGAEACDVTIRCYLLPRAIEEALDELEDEVEE